MTNLYKALHWQFYVYHNIFVKTRRWKCKVYRTSDNSTFTIPWHNTNRKLYPDSFDWLHRSYELTVEDTLRVPWIFGGGRGVGGGGTACLPKSKFLAKFPIGLHVILKLQIKKIQNLLKSDAQNYFNPKSIGVQPCTPL